jgi:peptide chain release factor subunit 1
MAFPSSAQLAELLRRLADVDAGQLPVLSIYLDMRAQATGESPGRRASLTVLRDRMREIERTYWPRGEDFDSVRADMDRVQQFLDTSFDPAAHGLAVFACSAVGLWETVEAGVPFRDSVSVGPTVDLFQLARLVDEHETAVVALVDTNTARLFVTRTGRLTEVSELDEPTDSFRKRSIGGWSQARYQRHIDKHIADFARGTAAAIEELVDREDARRLVLAGDEVAITPLLDAMPAAVRQRVGDVLRVDIRAPRDDLAAEVRMVLREAEADDSASVADAVIAAVRSGGLGVTGVDDTRRALEAGAVDVLVLSAVPGTPPDRSDAHDARNLADRGETREEDEAGGVDLDTRNELARLAAATAADIEVATGHPALDHAGGVGALLRYRTG